MKCPKCGKDASRVEITFEPEALAGLKREGVTLKEAREAIARGLIKQYGMCPVCLHKHNHESDVNKAYG
jgi:hypothetical protein